MEDGEISTGFLPEAEMESRRALAEAHGDGTGGSASWVEAVVIGAGRVDPRDPEAAEMEEDEGDPEASIDDVREPAPPGTAADHPPPPAGVLARREAALVHSVMALLRDKDDPEMLLDLLSRAANDGVDIARWLGHGRSSVGGRTPLMEATVHGRTACCALLAEASSTRERGLNARNERGKHSALHYACYHGAAGAAVELLVRGADPRLRNAEGETPLQSALANVRRECAELVRDFLRRPTFEPEAGSEAGVSGAGEGSPGTNGGAGGGVATHAAAAPEVCRANAMFCLGRRRRRLGARVRPGRGLGVGVGTAAAEVGLGARRGARLYATNPCAGTPMEAYVLWSIASGQDPFCGEGGVSDAAEEGAGDEDRGASSVWLDYYVRVYNASLRRWFENRESAEQGVVEGGASAQAGGASRDPAGDVPGDGAVAGSSQSVYTESAYELVVKESKALEVGERFALPCGSDMVIGRSQSLAAIVIRDELVSKSHLRIINSPTEGVRVCDLGSKHGAVITKPAPAPLPEREGGVGARPAGLAKRDLPAGSAAGAGAATAAPPPKKKFFPIPIPREPEWVAGAHGDSISLGRTVLVLEREGGPEPPRRASGRSPPVAADAAAATMTAKTKQRPAVISKGFAANPNLMDAIKAAESSERARKRTVAASLAAAAAAADYLENKRARSSAIPAVIKARSSSMDTGRDTNQQGFSLKHAAAPSVEQGGLQNRGADGRLDSLDDFEHVSKGNMLLKRMGWTQGQGLGRRSDGQLQPVQVVRRGDRAGLGSAQPGNDNPFAIGADGRISKWEQMRRRFAEAQSAGPGYGSSKRPETVRWLKGEVQRARP